MSPPARRNPPSARADRRARLASGREGPRSRFGPPDAATLLKMREELYARRGFSEIAPAESIASARRQGRWARGVDLREADDAEIAWLWREHRCDAEMGPAPLSSEVIPRMLQCSPAHAREVVRGLRAEGAFDAAEGPDA